MKGKIGTSLQGKVIYVSKRKKKITKPRPKRRIKVTPLKKALHLDSIIAEKEKRDKRQQKYKRL